MTSPRMTSSTLAQQFADSGLCNTWLSPKRTAFLASLAKQEDPRGCGRRMCTGIMADGSAWTMYISPKNKCGLFKTEFESESRGRQKEASLGHATSDYIQHATDRGF